MTMITGKKESIEFIHYQIKISWNFVAAEFTDNVRSEIQKKFRKMKTRGDVDKIVEWLRKVVSKSKGVAKLKRQTALRIYKKLLDSLYMVQTLT